MRLYVCHYLCLMCACVEKEKSGDQRLKDTTTVFCGKETSILAPGEVRPGHIMLAPLRMNLIAPLSTCTWGRIMGSGGRGEGRGEG